MKGSFKNSRMIVLALLALTFSVLGVTPAYAATITVANNSDSGAGSLRAAIAATSVGDTINFGGDYTIALASTLTIIKTLTIDGVGHTVTVSGNNSCSVFTITAKITFNLQNITVSNGKGYTGGAITYGEDAHSYGGTLNVVNTTFSSNSAVTGGAIYLAGEGGDTTTANVTNSTFSGNSAVRTGTPAARGGAIYNRDYSNLTVINSTFSGNSAPTTANNDGYSTGSSIANTGGTVTLKNTIIANHGTGTANNCYDGDSQPFTDGGGNLEDRNDCYFTAGTSKISTNPLHGTLGSYGGKTQTFPLLPGSPAIDAGISATCSAAPVSGKDQRGVTRPSACDIGAFESQGFALGSLTGTPQNAGLNTAFATPLGLTVTSAFSEPVAGGKVAFTPPGSGASAAIVTSPATIGSDSKVSVTATANGTTGSYDVVAGAVGAAASVNFALTNGISTTTTLGSSLNPATFGQSVTFTATVAPAPTGGTVTFKDGGTDIAGCVAVSLSSGQATCTTALLSLGAHTITAYYSGDATSYNSTGTLSPNQQINCGSAVTVTSNTDNGPGSLRQAIAGSCTGGTITFANDYTITLASTLTINQNLTIDGETHAITISGNDAVRVFYLGNYDNPVRRTIALKRITVAHGKAVNGNPSCPDCGGGVYVNDGVTLTVTNSVFSHNTARLGGAILRDEAPEFPNTTMTVTNSTFSNNSSFSSITASGGGGIYTDGGTLNVTSCSFSGNSAGGGGDIPYGGGISHYSGTLNVTNSTFSGNSVGSSDAWGGQGGGIYSWDTLNVTNTTFSGNTAENGTAYSGQGGAIYTGGTTGPRALKNVILANNTNGSCFAVSGSTPLTDGGGNLEDGTSCGFSLGSSKSSTNPLLGTLGYYPGTATTQTFPLLPGSPAIDAGVNGCGSTDQRGVSRVGACDSGAFESQGFTLGSLTGTPQSASVNATFATPLGLTVTSKISGEPVAGGKITFTPPASGASAALVTSPATIASGTVSVSATANDQIGRYSVVASATGATGQIFELQNTTIVTTTRLSSSSNPSVPGQSVTFTATVSTPGSDTPQVTFKDGGTIICNLVDVKYHASGDGVATATCTTSALALGAHTITAIYSDNSGGGALDATLTQTVNTCTSAITVTSGADTGDGSLRQAIAGVCVGGTISFDNDYTILLASELAISKDLTVDGTGHKVTVSGNHVTRVFNVATGTVTFKRLTIADGNTQTTDCGNATDGSASTAICGGGLILQNSSVVVTVTDSAFSGNKATFGGGIYNTGTLTVTNSTFSGNSADYGGGVINAGTLTMTNSTLSGNSATANGGGMNNIGTINLYNTLLANSPSGSDCYRTAGTITGDHNLIETDSPTKPCGTTSPIVSDPILDVSLADNGGDTPTFALLPGSPGIDAGDSATCAATPVNGKDQRGIARPQGSSCDIGAFESQGFTLGSLTGTPQSAPITTAFATAIGLTVTSTHSEPVDGGVVTFTPPVTGASAAITGSPATIASGMVSVTATANATVGGPYDVVASTTGATNANFSLTNTAIPPAITSANSTVFIIGVPGTFTVTTTGSPTPSVSQSGIGPSGVTFTDNHDGTATIQGTPAGGSAGIYPWTITAHNGGGADATQDFTLTVYAGMGFYPVTPCRVFDTRDPGGPTFGNSIGASGNLKYNVTTQCEIPATAKAIVANVTVVNATTTGELEIIAGDQSSNAISIVQVPASRARANNATIQLAIDGAGTILVINHSSGTVHVIVDVNGYFE